LPRTCSIGGASRMGKSDSSGPVRTPKKQPRHSRRTGQPSRLSREHYRKAIQLSRTTTTPPETNMTTFITTLHATGTGPRLAVKDLIDVAGVPSTAGCRAVARTATPAVADAAPPGRRPRRGCGDRRKDEPARAGDVAVGDKPVVRHPGEPAGPVLDRRWILERVSGRGRKPCRPISRWAPTPAGQSECPRRVAEPSG